MEKLYKRELYLSKIRPFVYKEIQNVSLMISFVRVYFKCSIYLF